MRVRQAFAGGRLDRARDKAARHRFSDRFSPRHALIMAEAARRVEMVRAGVRPC